MANYREIVTKAVIAKGKKLFTTENKVNVENSPSTILGCWVINHNFNGVKSGDSIRINGSYDVNIWYSYDNDTKTQVIKETNNYMINIIITDAEFNIKENEVNKFLNEVDGFVIFVTNNSSSPVEEIAKKNKLKLLYIQADSQFTTKGEA